MKKNGMNQRIEGSGDEVFEVVGALLSPYMRHFGLRHLLPHYRPVLHWNALPTHVFHSRLDGGDGEIY